MQPRPSDLELSVERSRVAALIGVARETAQLAVVHPIAEALPLGQVVLYRAPDGAEGDHVALPGQGIATASSRRRSTLA